MRNENNLDKEVIVGIVAGLLMYWAQIATEEIMKIFRVTGYIWKIFFSFLIAILISTVFIRSYNKKSK